MFDGLALAIGLFFILLIYVPSVTIIALKQANIFEKYTEGKRLALYIITYLALTLLVVFINRVYQFRALEGMLVYCIILTLTIIIQWLIKRRKTKNR